jgi:glycine/D-amino acid oxidase-like deaminating enzyme
VVTEQGRIACDQVVVAGGAWSRLFLQAHGIAIPQLAVRATVAVTGPLPQVYAGAAADGHIAFRRRMDGGYTLAPGAGHDVHLGPDLFRSFGAFLKPALQGLRHTRFHATAPRGFPDAWSTPRRWDADRPSPFEAMRVLDPAPSRRLAGRLARDFRAAFPRLPEVRLTRTWAGMIDTMPDVVPVVDHAPIPGVFVATGMSGHGFGIAPAFGRIIADMLTGQAPGHDMHRFRLSRFSDGSKLVQGPSL